MNCEKAPCLPFVGLPGRERSLKNFALKLAEHLQQAPLFNHNSTVTELDCDTGKSTPMEAAVFPTWIEDYVRVGNSKGLGGPYEYWDEQSLSEKEARLILNSNQFKRSLRALTRINHARQPVFERDKTIELLPFSWHEPSGIYTLKTVEFDERMDIRRAKRVFEQYLGEFPYTPTDFERIKSAARAFLLTAFCDRLIPVSIPRPGFIIKANRLNVGKTTLATLALCPVFGAAATRKPFSKGDDPELRKLLAAVVRYGIPYIFFDNCRGQIANSALEAFMTAKTWSGSQLYTDVPFEGVKQCLVIIVAQPESKINDDLTRRSILIELFADNRPLFSRPLDAEDVANSRGDLLAASWSYVRHWQSKGCKPATRLLPGFSKWSAVIGGIIEAAGHPTPFSSPPEDPKETPNQDTKDFELTLHATLSDPKNPDCLVTPDSLLEIARKNRCFTRFLASHRPESGFLISEKASFQHVCRRFLQVNFASGVAIRPVAKSRPKKYRVFRIENGAEKGIQNGN